jgi:hypothetical protein
MACCRVAIEMSGVALSALRLETYPAISPWILSIGPFLHAVICVLYNAI